MGITYFYYVGVKTAKGVELVTKSDYDNTLCSWSKDKQPKVFTKAAAAVLINALNKAGYDAITIQASGVLN